MFRSMIAGSWLMVLALAGQAPPAPRVGADLVVTGVGVPNGVMARPDESNPVIRGKNLYAPDLVKNGQAWNLYYGGWRNPAELNDRIYASVCVDPWLAGPWQGGFVVMDVGNYLHVNDPSVQKLAPGQWVMAFTVASRLDGHDWIGIASSRDGLTFEPRVARPDCEIQVAGAPFTFMGRPSILWDGKVWKLWFDGKVNGGPLHSYLAESDEAFPKHFRLVHSYPDVDGFPGFFAPDVELIDGLYVAVIQRKFTSLAKMESRDGVHFVEKGTILRADTPALGKKVVSNPGWIADLPGRRMLGVAVSLSDDTKALSNQSIGFAYHQLGIEVDSPPNVTHLFARARGFDAAVPMTFGYRRFVRLRVNDPQTHAKILDQPINAAPGDLLRIVPSPPSPGIEE